MGSRVGSKPISGHFGSQQSHGGHDVGGGTHSPDGRSIGGGQLRGWW